MTTPRQIIIVDYRPEWPDEYAAIARPLREALGDLALRVDHIGSTSVPGLAAKDVIDVQITVRDFSPAIEPAIVQLGYMRIATIDRDHRPPPPTGPDEDWTKQIYTRAPEPRRTNVHVRRAGSPNGRYALLFRDYLRDHPLAAQAYAQAKKALAAHGPTDWEL